MTGHDGPVLHSKRIYAQLCLKALLRRISEHTLPSVGQERRQNDARARWSTEERGDGEGTQKLDESSRHVLLQPRAATASHLDSFRARVEQAVGAFFIARGKSSESRS